MKYWLSTIYSVDEYIYIRFHGTNIVSYLFEMSNYSKVSYKDFWEEKYLTNYTPWDIGEVAPAFIKYFTKEQNQEKKHINVAVLGCGRGHDAFYIANHKKSSIVYGFDFSYNAIRFCNKKKNEINSESNTYFHQVDFFELVNEKKWSTFFDLVIEHTSLCAIEPKRRGEYVNLIKYLLKPKGLLIGLFFMRPKELSGPPYGSTPDEIRTLLQEGFTEIEKLHIEECLHKNKLEGDEYFGVFERMS